VEAGAARTFVFVSDLYHKFHRKTTIVITLMCMLLFKDRIDLIHE